MPVAKPVEGDVSRSGEAEKPLLALWRCLAVWVDVSSTKGMMRSMGSCAASGFTSWASQGYAAFVAF